MLPSRWGFYFVRCSLEFLNLSEESPVQGFTQGPKASPKARDSKKPATPHATPRQASGSDAYPFG